MNHATPAARTIAAGGNPEFTHTVVHPQHGELTFRARLPLSVDSLRHSIEMDNLLQGLAGDASWQTRVVAAAIAGMTVPEEPGRPAGHALMLELPVVRREPDADDDGRVRQYYYDASAEMDLPWLTDVWMAYSAWRTEQLSDDTVEAVGKSSGDPSTSSDASSTPSAAATAPPSQTPAS
jgi:hypothetical protein